LSSNPSAPLKKKKPVEKGPHEVSEAEEKPHKFKELPEILSAAP
jgi:hypothetical protein